MATPERAPSRRRIDVCYVCGEKLTKPWSKDHLPPKCFFASLVMEELKPDRLWTLPTHVACNNSFKDDEEYFVETMRTRVRNTWAGGPLHFDFLDRLTKRDQSKRLFGTIFREMRWQPFATSSASGTVLVGIEHDEARVTRVFWKIVRGLFFREHGRWLPEETTKSFVWFSSAEELPAEKWPWWRTASGAGCYPYPMVFDYRFQLGKDTETGDEVWALRLWDGLIWLVGFPAPAIAVLTR
jgi:hypothetical protein